MKHATVYSIFLFLVLSILPGCGRYIDWGKNIFYQGEQISADMASVKPYIQSVTIYDQLTTRAIFDALWLSDDVRSLYSDLYAHKFGKTAEQKKLFLRRQLEDNNHYFSFYVLSLHEVPLGDSTSEWGVFLRVDDTLFAPMEVKVIELPAEYEQIFGKLFTRFKIAYSVKFDKIDGGGTAIVTDQTKKLELYFRAVDKEAKLVWDFKKSN